MFLRFSEIKFHLKLTFFIAFEKVKIQTNAYDIVYRQDSVCDCKHPISDQITVDRKTD